MKKIGIILLTFVISLPLFAQGKVTTRKHRLADFTDKMTQVVLSGDEVLNAALRKEIPYIWTSSTFEFCSLEQFEKIKTQDKYYFLIPAESIFKGEEEPGVRFLTLVKGGPSAKDGISAMHEVVSLPVAAAMGTTDRDLVYLGGIIQAIQEFTLAAMESESAAYKMSEWFNGRFKKSIEDKKVYIAQEDLSDEVNEKALAKLENNLSLHIVPSSESDWQYVNQSPDTVVGYVIAPIFPTTGSVCYKLLFEADTHRLCYLERHKISEKKGEGFLASELKPLGK
jgi:hypothetical protein